MSWSNVERAIENLRKAKVLSARGIRLIAEEQLCQLVRPSGYFRQKARRLKIFVEFLFEHYRGGISSMKRSGMKELRGKLLSINGIGPETADSIILYAVEKPVFVVDAYTRRILSRHGLLRGNAGYDETQLLFHRSLEADVAMYNEYHALIVRTGKEYCRTRNPLCSACPLGGTDSRPAVLKAN